MHIFKIDSTESPISTFLSTRLIYVTIVDVSHYDRLLEYFVHLEGWTTDELSK